MVFLRLHCICIYPGPPPASQKAPAKFSPHVLAAVVTFLMTLFVYLRSISFHIKKKLPGVPIQHEQTTLPSEDLRLQSRDTEILSLVLKRLGELEEKVSTLLSKPSEMPHEKEELLNAAVYRVDALEAELIATKKVLHLYID